MIMTHLCRKKIQIFLIVQEIIEQSLFFINLVIALLQDERFGDRRSREQVVRYVMAHRRPDQVSHMTRIVELSDTSCVDNLRMNRNAFGRLCYLLEHIGGLEDSRHVSLSEKVCLFLLVLAHHKKNCIVKHDFIRFRQTISIHFNAVLIALLKLYPLILVTPEPVEAKSTDSRYKGCLGALDGSYINVRVGDSEKPRYRNRTGEFTINLLGVVDRSCKFVYMLPSWEGSAADPRVLRNAINRPHGLRVPSGGDLRPEAVNECIQIGESVKLKSRVGLIQHGQQPTPRAYHRSHCTTKLWLFRSEEMILGGDEEC
ncbi:hypothetical protein BUALT_Bualt12G0098400 [Buddleja alternifolia]|uniref:DUF8040 domain-containing protein n=1 Tax=Buddleja alternifolia TaxID=168488 RepID=A0AAV6WWR4_9LAMI|nr:hypothetical protein BUALT_Bualt12G0098400 [Buddleja alternifolia]